MRRPPAWNGRIGRIAIPILLLAVASTPGTSRAGIQAGFVPATVTVAPGDTFSVYLSILAADSQFNAFDASIRFDPARLTFEPSAPVADQPGPVMTTACANTFHLFTPTADSLKITLSVLCNQVFVTGPGTIYRVRFRAGLTTGITTISLGAFTEFYRAGLFVRPLARQDLVVTIGGATDVEPEPGARPKLEFAPPAPNPGRGQGAVSLDFTLPGPDVVRFAVLDVQGRCIAERMAERFEKGPHHLSWSPPALASGGYFVRLDARSAGSAVRRWVVLQ